MKKHWTGQKLASSKMACQYWKVTSSCTEDMIYIEAKLTSVPDVVCAELHAIRKRIVSSQRNNGPMDHDEQSSESSPTHVSPSGIMLLLTTKSLSDDLKKVKNGEMDIEKICLGCMSSNTELAGQHPFFKGSLCKTCMEKLKENVFAFGDDGIHIYCAICSNPGDVFICSKPECSKVYCHHCIDLLAGDGAVKWIDDKEPWLCFLCDDALPSVCGLIKPRPDWMNCQKVSALFSVNEVTSPVPPPSRPKSALRVLSLFDGISTGMVVLKMLGIKVEKYYASEVDKDAINVSRLNHGGMIEHIGAIETLNEGKLSALGPIDLLLGGSPCADLSLANPARKGLYDTSGSGSLFFEFYRVLKTLQMTRDNCIYWMFENTAAMPHRIRDDITRFMGIDPVLIDASWFSAQHRARLFWGNVPGLGKTMIPEVNIKLQDCLLPGMNRRAVVEKIRTVTTNTNSLRQGKNMAFPVTMNGNADTLWMTELETIFGFPVHYTDAGNMSISKRQQLLGKAWSVHAVKHILQSLKLYFECELM
ncbi:hypothetical protein Cfor_01628 [Coptotermes formosanus]|uniref:DNA (cytosine-5-)-methyltransferase n=1 Tax=Coptotermes formosanus TaxID=36987 RepID=A0A6L2Q3M7_COPFO|nr:hypothetical protein Cfor_01628 [Coptotermes formosanus]